MKIKITEHTTFGKPSLKRKHPICEEGGVGIQRIWRFKNNFGASVVIFTTMMGMGGSYGNENRLYELAVLEFKSDEDYGLTYKTGITNDVIGYLTPEKVEALLKTIKKLRRKK